ncbi:MAG: DUF4157 domain-containing protein [Thermonemataceae bacterium]
MTEEERRHRIWLASLAEEEEPFFYEGEQIPVETSTGEETTNAHQLTLVVEDEATPATFQLTKTAFLTQLQAHVIAVVEEVLTESPYSSEVCPYIERVFLTHQQSSAQELLALLYRYAPFSRQARSATEMVTIIGHHAREAAQQWLQEAPLVSIHPEVAAQIPSQEEAEASTVSLQAKNKTSGSLEQWAGGIFRKAWHNLSGVSLHPRAVLRRLGRGRPLDSTTREQMEQAFGQNFGEVEVHTDATAVKLSEEMNARAFTVGNHIAFNVGQYQPGTPLGDALLAHELAHVVQQQGAEENYQAKSVNGAEYDSLEQEADQAAVGVVGQLYGGKAKGGSQLLSNLKGGLQLQRCCEADVLNSLPEITAELSEDELEDARDLLDTRLTLTPDLSDGNVGILGTTLRFGFEEMNLEDYYVHTVAWTLYRITPRGEEIVYNPRTRLVNNDEYVRAEDFTFTDAGQYRLEAQITLSSLQDLALIVREFRVEDLTNFLYPTAALDISRQQVGTSLAADLASFEAHANLIRRNAIQFGVSSALIERWFEANQVAILVENQLANQPDEARPQLPSDLAESAQEKFSLFYESFREEVASRDSSHTETIQIEGEPVTVTHNRNPYFTASEMRLLLWQLQKERVNWRAKMGAFVRKSRSLDEYLMTQLRAAGMNDSADQLHAAGSLSAALRDVQARHPTAFPIRAVFYPDPSEREENPGVYINQGTTDNPSYDFQGVEMRFYLAREGNTWHLIDVTNPENVQETQESGGNARTPPDELFEELDSADRFPKGVLFWQLPRQRMRQYRMTNPLGLSGIFSAFAIAATLASIPFTGGATATILIIAGATAGVAAAGLDMYERAQRDTLTTKDVVINTVDIVGNLVTLGTASLGRIVLRGVRTAQAGRQLTGASARLAALADRSFMTLSQVSLGQNLVSLGVFSADFIHQYTSIEGNSAQAENARRRLIQQALLTGAFTLLAVRGDLSDIRGGRNLYLDFDAFGNPIARAIRQDTVTGGDQRSKKS